MSEMPDGLLAADEPMPVTIYNANAPSPFLLVADHAGNLMPRALGRLGVSAAECERHIAWDIGIAGLGRLLADALDATFIQQTYSRLVIDSNRPPGTATSIPDISEHTLIPGNVGLSESAMAARAREIFWPYHQHIEAELERRRQRGRPAVLVALHSFTPVFKSATRVWHAGVLYHRDPRLAHRLLTLLREENGLNVGDNEPYSVSDASDFTIPVHGEQRGLLHALMEIRQDLIADEKGQRAWALILTRLLPKAYQELEATEDIIWRKS